jgi:hypothetical protein
MSISTIDSVVIGQKASEDESSEEKLGLSDVER